MVVLLVLVVVAMVIAVVAIGDGWALTDHRPAVALISIHPRIHKW